MRRWKLEQTAEVENADPGTIALTLTTALGAGHLVVVAVEIEPFGEVTSITDDSGCNTYSPVPRSHSSSADIGVALELHYVANSCAGARAIQITATDPNLPFPLLIPAAVIWEVSGIKTTNPLDTAAALNDQAASATPRGPQITTSEPGEFVVTVVMAEAGITGIHAGNEFIKDSLAQGNGWGHLGDSNARAGVHQAQWDQTPQGLSCASAAAFRVGP